MEIIEIQCGSCNEMMAISVDHLGTQVHCPHCQAIVQAPPREALAPAAAQATTIQAVRFMRVPPMMRAHRAQKKAPRAGEA